MVGGKFNEISVYISFAALHLWDFQANKKGTKVQVNIASNINLLQI